VHFAAFHWIILQYCPNEIILVDFHPFWEGLQYHKSPTCDENRNHSLLPRNTRSDSWHDRFSGCSKHQIRTRGILKPGFVPRCNRLEIVFCARSQQG
jgi:hypothetical protein